MQDRPSREPRSASLLHDLLAGHPLNWGRWGEDDEVGSLNFLGPSEVLRGVAAVRAGRVFTLGTPLARPAGDPVWPGRPTGRRYAVQDKSTYDAGLARSEAGDEFADDVLFLSLHGTTHTDALGHVWYDDALYNGYPARSTTARLTRDSVLPLAERGIVGRGVLVDLARATGKESLGRGEPVELSDLLAAARRQRLEIEKRDILLLRTGWLALHERDPAEFAREPFAEPGLVHSRALVDWFHEREIPALGTDTLGNELTLHPGHGDISALHAALMRNLGIVFTEMLRLEELAAACAEADQWTFLYAAAPLKVVAGSAAPTNPVVVM
jgi:kynurenine formamidase